LRLDPRFCGSNPTDGDRLLRETKIRSTLSFGGQVKPSIPCPRFCGMLKKPSTHEKDMSQDKYTIPLPVYPALLLDDSVDRIARDLQWTKKEFFLVDIMASMLIYHLGVDNRPFVTTVQRRRVTTST
jgi:hypothetical protein